MTDKNMFKGLNYRSLDKQVGGKHYRNMKIQPAEFINENKNVFRVLLREHTGTSAEFRAAVQREIQHFIKELSDYIMHRQKISQQLADLESEAMVMIVFSAGAQALDAQPKQQFIIAEKVKYQLMFVQLGVRQFKPQ